MIRKLMIASAAALICTVGTAQAQKVVLKLAAFTPAKSNVVSGAYQPWIKAVKADLGDQIELKEFWGGSLGRSPVKQYELVRDGIADVNLIVPGYTPGQFPGIDVFELPYLVRNGEEGSIAAWRLYEKGLIGGTDQIHILSAWTTEPYQIHSAKKMMSLADAKGLKLRSAGPVQSAIAKHIGAVPIGMPVPKASESIRRGVLDGALIGLGGSNTFKVYKVTKYHYTAPLGVLPFLLAVNKATWAKLPDNVKKVLEKHAGEKWARIGGKAFEKTGATLDKKLRSEGKHTFIDLTEAQFQASLKAMMPVHTGWIKRTENGQQIYDTLQSILKDVRAGK